MKMRSELMQHDRRWRTEGEGRKRRMRGRWRRRKMRREPDVAFLSRLFASAPYIYACGREETHQNSSICGQEKA